MFPEKEYEAFALGGESSYRDKARKLESTLLRFYATTGGI